MDSALFYSEVKDAIEEVAISKKLNQYQNVGKEAFKGVELAVNVFATDNLTLGANYTYTPVSYTHLDVYKRQELFYAQISGSFVEKQGLQLSRHHHLLD